MYDHLRWLKFGWLWTIGSESCVIVWRYAASQPSVSLVQRLCCFWSWSKTWMRFPILYGIVPSSREVVWHRLAPCHVAPIHTIFSYVLTCSAFSQYYIMVVRHLTRSYEVARPSYDFDRVPMIASASRKTMVIQSYNLVWMSYDGRAMSYDFHTNVPYPDNNCSQTFAGTYLIKRSGSQRYACINIVPNDGCWRLWKYTWCVLTMYWMKKVTDAISTHCLIVVIGQKHQLVYYGDYMISHISGEEDLITQRMTIELMPCASSIPVWLLMCCTK